MASCSSVRPAAPSLPCPCRRAVCCRSAGFSLVELAIVVLIVSILLTMGLAAFSVQVDTAALSATQKRQEAIKDALIAYLRTNRRLPCPETTGLAGGGTSPTGRENRTNGSPPDPSFPCSSYVGTLPWLDLGLPKDTALDGYGNFLTYFVSSAASDSDPDWTRTANLVAVPSVTGFSVGSPGRFAITHNGQTTGVDASLYPLPALTAVVLVSHGKNGFGAITEKGTRNADSADASELANQPPTATTTAPAWTPQVTSPIDYASLGMRSPAVTSTLVTGSTTAGGTFDDVVLALRPDDLIGPIIKDGAMKSAQAQLSEQFSKIKTAFASYAFTNGIYGTSACTTLAPPPYCRVLPPSPLVIGTAGLTVTDITDPWGITIRYTPFIATTPSAGVGLTNSTLGNAFTLASDGPDRTQSTPDDTSVTVSAIELRQMIGTSNLP